MSDTTLNRLGDEILKINKANGWNVTKNGDWEDCYKMAAATALIHTEVAEATEAIRKGDEANFAEELADTLIRVLDVARGLSYDMDSIVAAKLEKNRNRGHRHGGKRL